MSKMRIPTRNGLVGEWLLDGSGIDTSGNGNNGTFTNGSYATTDRGYQSQCGVFNGTNAYVSTNFSASNFTGTYSIVGWFSKSTVGTLKDVCSVANNSAPYNDIMSIRVNTSGKLEFNHVSGVSTYETLASTQTVTDGKPHFFEAKFTGTTMSLTVDDVTVTRSSGGNSSTSGGVPNLRIGRNGDYSPSFNYFDGIIQSIRIFNRYLSSDDRQDYYLEGLRKLGGGSLSGLMDGLVGYWDTNGDGNDIVGGRNFTTGGSVPLTTDWFGNSNRAFSFSQNTSNYLRSTSTLTPGTVFSCGFWFKGTNNTQGDNAGICLNIGGTGPNFQVTFNSTNRVFHLLGWTGSTTQGLYYGGSGATYNNTYNDTNWHFVFCTRNGNTWKIYVDGTLHGSTTSGGTNNWSAYQITIGRNNDYLTQALNGQIGGWMVFEGIEKSASEVLALYQLSSREYLLPFA